MKITLFNDGYLDWWLHAASAKGIEGESIIPARASVDFEVLEGHDVFIKIWGRGMVMVRQSIKTECPRLPGIDQDEPDHMGG